MEVKLLRRILGNDKKVLRILKKSIPIKGFSTHGIYVERPDGRGTGDPLTSSGNSSLAGLIYWHIFHTCASNSFFGYDPECPPFAFTVQGDDVVAIMDPRLQTIIQQLGGFTALLVDYGFVCKFEKYTDSYFEVDYCSRWFYPAENDLGCILCPKPWRVLYKMAYSKELPQNIKQHYRGVALGLYLDSRPVPFLRVVVDWFIAYTDGTEANPTNTPYSIHVCGEHQVLPTTWQVMLNRYGLTPHHEEDLRKALSVVDSLPWKLDLPWLTDEIMSFDID